MNLSVVTPVFDEVDKILLLHEARQRALETCEHPWEVALVDDGSLDGSLQALEILTRTYHESQQKPIYTVCRVINGKNALGV